MKWKAEEPETYYDAVKREGQEKVDSSRKELDTLEAA